MAISANTYSAHDVSGTVSPLVIERRAVGAKDVLIRVKFCGICHSDLHTLRNEWSGTKYPCCAGHEVAGEVQQVGAEVTKHKVGDLVGVGCMVDSCRTCEQCVSGNENYCPKKIFTYNSVQPDGKVTFGGYSTHIVVDESFVVRMPTRVGLAEAAPLLCAGATVYTPMKQCGFKAGEVVGVLGLGGLGHVAVKIAAAMGCEVVVISRKQGKEEEAITMGAKRVLISSDKDAMAAAAQSLHYIIDTVSAPHDLPTFLGLLKTRGTLIVVGLPPVPLPLGMGALIGRNLRIMGSLIAGIPDTQEMLDFCDKHGIGAEIELISADYINTAMDRLQASDVHYRFVIDIEKTLPLP